MIIVQVCVGSLRSNYKMDLSSKPLLNLSVTSNLGHVNLEPLAGRFLNLSTSSGVLGDLHHGQGDTGGGERRRRGGWSVTGSHHNTATEIKLISLINN